MIKQISDHAAAAKLIRTELKKNGVKGTVRASSYAGGSSITVNLGDVLPATRSAVADFAGRFEYGHFNGMTDCYEYSNTNADLPQVSFVFVNVERADETRQAAWDYCRKHWAGMEDAPESAKDARYFYCSAMNCYGDSLINRTMSDDYKGGFWAQFKQRVAA